MLWSTVQLYCTVQIGAVLSYTVQLYCTLQSGAVLSYTVKLYCTLQSGAALWNTGFYSSRLLQATKGTVVWFILLVTACLVGMGEDSNFYYCYRHFNWLNWQNFKNIWRLMVVIYSITEVLLTLPQMQNGGYTVKCGFTLT